MLRAIAALGATLLAFSAAAQQVHWDNSEQCWAIWKQRSALWQQEYAQQSNCWAAGRCRNPGADPRFKEMSAQNSRLEDACRASRQAEMNAKRLADQQRQDLARQQELRAEYQRRQQQQYAGPLERRENTPQQRVIGTVPQSAYNTTPRVVGSAPQSAYSNQPREVRTPQREKSVQEQQAEALGGLFTALANAASRRPGNSGPVTAEANAAINAGRGGSPVAGAIGGSALAAAGARSTDTITQFEQAMNNPDLVGAPTGNSSSTWSPPTPSLPRFLSFPSSSTTSAASSNPDRTAAPAATGTDAAPTPSAFSLPKWVPGFLTQGQPTGTGNGMGQEGGPPGGQPADQAAGGPTLIAQAPVTAVPATSGTSSFTSPKEACGKRVFIALARCIAEQCQKADFSQHEQCKPTQ